MKKGKHQPRGGNKLKALGIGMTSLVLLSGCFDSDSGNGDRDLMGDGTSGEQADFSALAGLWEGPVLFLRGSASADGVDGMAGSIGILADGTIDFIRGDFTYAENLTPEREFQRIYSWQRQDGRREFIQLLNDARTHAMGITLDGRPILTERGGVQTTHPASAIVGDWQGDMFAVDDFPPRLVDREEDVTFTVHSDQTATLNIPGICQGIRLGAFEQSLDAQDGINYWLSEGLLMDVGEGADCPGSDVEQFARVILSPDATHIGLSACENPVEAAEGCGLFLMARTD